MSVAFISGIEGSAAQYLVDYISSLQKDIQIHGISRKLTKNPLYTTHQGDLCDLSSTIRILRQVQPDYIFHLAANADVKYSYDAPISVLHNNIDNTVNLYEAIRAIPSINPIVQMCSTSEVYGNNCGQKPIKEDSPLEPANIYAISKLTQEKIAKFYNDVHGIRTVITRSFSYVNPRRANIFSTAFAQRIVDLEKNGGGQLKHGNLNSVRAFLDIRDIVRIYWDLSVKPFANFDGLFGVPINVGSPIPVSVQDVLTMLLSYTKAEIELVQDESLMRPNDVSYQIPDVSRLMSKLDFKQTYSLDESIRWLISYTRENF